MFTQVSEKLTQMFDVATQFLWETFEKDMAMTEAVISRTEAVFATIEEKIVRTFHR